MLLLTPRKSLVVPQKKPCCAGCLSGKPCCGSTTGVSHPEYRKQGALWLPERESGTGERKRRRAVEKLDIPVWPRDRNFILAVEKIMPVRRVKFRYGNAARWQRQMSNVRALLTVPPDQWGGLVRWDLPAYMPAFDLTCTGCCDDMQQCCCNDPPPATLFLTLLADGGSCSNCNGGDALASGQAMVATELCPVFTGSNGSFNYEATGNFFCQAESFTLQCTAGISGDPVVELTIDGAGDNVTITMEILACSPFSASGSDTIPGSQLIELCGDDGTTGETFSATVTE
jgi:hypothetical protein